MTQLPVDRSTSAPEPYKTSDTPFAAFLYINGHKVVTSRQDPNDYKREVLIFVKDDDVEILERQWRMNSVDGDLKAFHRALKIINRLINDARKARGL
jgi:hypothetical protein